MNKNEEYNDEAYIDNNTSAPWSNEYLCSI